MVMRMDYLNYRKESQSSLSTGGVKVYKEPFPHLILENFYDEKELELIWEELKFYTKPKKLLGAEHYNGAVGYTNAKAISLDSVYIDYSTSTPDTSASPLTNYRDLSNILTVNRKLFTSGVLKTYADMDHCCNVALRSSHDYTKVRYYHDGEYYKPHVDAMFNTLAFSYFHKEPKAFSGGELYFPYYNYEFPCDNNTFIIFPGWVEHGVREVKIKESDYFDGLGRYAITSFLTTRERQL